MTLPICGSPLGWDRAGDGSVLPARGVQGGQHEHQIGLYTAPRNCRAASFGTGRALRWKANRWVRRDATVDNISSVFSNLFHVAPSRALLHCCWLDVPGERSYKTLQGSQLTLNVALEYRPSRTSRLQNRSYLWFAKTFTVHTFQTSSWSLP